MNLERLWRTGAFAVPEGDSGPWKVRRSFITPAQAAENRRQAELFAGPVRYSPAGCYTALIRNGEVWMADTPDEMRDHLECYEKAAELGGRVLIHGLGLGLITRAVLSLPNVEHVDVVELDEDVISLVAPAFAGVDVDTGRLVIHHGDCLKLHWPRDVYWQVIWHDIWQGMLEANLVEMDRLHRMFHARCVWQGSWGREWILEQRKLRIAAGNPLGAAGRIAVAYGPDLP